MILKLDVIGVQEHFLRGPQWKDIASTTIIEEDSIGRDFRDEHPLQHSTMIAIDLLGKESFFHRENLRRKQFETNEKSSHLLNRCSIHLSDEPCSMCSMALLHSRISSVFFLRSDDPHGSLLSNYNLHRLKQTNHRFHVYHLEEWADWSNGTEIFLFLLLSDQFDWETNEMLISRCFHFHRICSTTTTFVDIRRKFFFRNLFNHFQFAKYAKKEMKKRGIDLNNLTAEQWIK